MSQGILYSASSSRTLLLRGLIKYYKLDIKVIEKDDLYHKNFPQNKLPAFIDPKGFKLTEVIAIILYFFSIADPKSPLLGKNNQEYAQIIKWLSLSNSEWLPQLSKIIYQHRGQLPYNKKIIADSFAAADKVANVYESRLSEFTYLVGERLTLADLFAVSLTTRGFELFWGKEWRSKYPNIVRWFETVKAHPILAPEFEGFKYLDKPIEIASPKKEKKEKTPAPVKAKATKPVETSDAAPTPVATEEKKPKHPLEALGKSTKFNLDEWKRIYSNEETRETAIPWFWENFDSSEWSLWRFDYKYNDELTLTFMSNNLLGGFFNRLGASTKYLFGSGIVYGENNNNGIVGVFLVRGQNHEPAFDVAPDWESYSFTKLDINKPEDKTFVNDVFAWDKPLVINGETREVADGKNFK